jgi:hypothetical protein
MIRTKCSKCGKEVVPIRFGAGWVGGCCGKVLYNSKTLPQTDEEYTEKVSVGSEESASTATQDTSREPSGDRARPKTIDADKRQYPRKKVILPAMVSWVGPEAHPPKEGIVLDISLGGLQILIPSAYHVDIKENKENSTLSVSITLHRDRQDLITMQCVPQRAYRSNIGNTIGASFCDTDAACSQTLQEYLIN